MYSIIIFIGVQVCIWQSSSAFSLFEQLKRTRSLHHDGDKVHKTLLTVKNRKARRLQQVEKSRPKQFFDAIEDAQDKKVVGTIPRVDDSKAPDAAVDSAAADRQARALAAQERIDQRPDVSTMIVDEETGVEIVAQGKNVMDVVTRKAVQLSPLGPQYRLAQMFPGVPPDVRSKYLVDWKTVEVPDLVEGFRNAAMVNLPDGSRGIPPHPSLSNNAIDYVVSNRHYLGLKMKKALGRMVMRSASLGNSEETRDYNKLWKNYLTVENYISGPFRQIIMDAEGRVGPNFGNLDLKSYCSGHLYERIGNYLVLKGMVAHWEKKVVDADYVERTPMSKTNYISILSRGDPKRYLPDPPILFTVRECTQVCAMAQKMTAEFVKTPSLYDDFPPEVRFLEQALSIKGGTPMRKFVIDEFCPAEGITPEGLREGLRRLMVQLESMQVDPYADLTNIIERLVNAMSVGTIDERDPYTLYLVNKDPVGPGAFQTYTMNFDKLSRVRFLDSQYDSAGSVSAPELPSVGLGNLFKFGDSSKPIQTQQSQAKVEDGATYKVPKERAVGRPHNLGWLDLLQGTDDQRDLRLGKIAAGKIIME
jgi:hypothetical protein